MLRLVALAVALAGAGCGTTVNLIDPSRDEAKVYGGVRKDAALIQQIVDGDSLFGASSSQADGAGALLLVGLMALPFLDLPLSLLGDTLTLPLTRLLDNR